jgi:aminopeptidase N
VRTRVVATVLTGLALALPSAAAGAVGAPGLGDPFFPLAGNGGYDVCHYGLRLSYEPTGNRLTGTARIAATATQDLARFDLDLRGFAVRRVAVDGRRATFARDGQELVITPARRVRAGRSFTVTVAYAGVPEVVTDLDGSIEGWVPTDDGAFVVGEPQGAPGWFPANDNPRDKATFDVVVTVPQGITAVGNGRLLAQLTAGGRTTFAWREGRPMAPYLATLTNGRFDVTRGRTPGGVPTYVAVDPSQAADAAPALARLGDIVDFFSALYGPYPFETAGAIVDHAPDAGYALESQTKPNFDSAPDRSTLVHELSHQWFGDAVTLAVWPDIWLHEGFATWSEWIWTERTGGRTAQAAFDALYATPAGSGLWSTAPAALAAPEELFGNVVYARGAMTLQALRTKVGDPVFFHILRRFYAGFRYGNATTADFEGLAERLSGQDLGRFFDVWLRRPVKPATW